MTMLLVEQNAHAALSIADRGYLETGRTTLEGPGRELLRTEAVRRRPDPGSIVACPRIFQVRGRKT
ncbi:MAG TPA: hypothetical protein VH764_02585 [Gemmatimonadales bacterium]